MLGEGGSSQSRAAKPVPTRLSLPLSQLTSGQSLTPQGSTSHVHNPNAILVPTPQGPGLPAWGEVSSPSLAPPHLP